MSPEPVTVPAPHGAMTVAGAPAGELWMPPLDAPCADAADRLVTLANRNAAHVTVQLPGDAVDRAELVTSTDPDRAAGAVDPERFILLPGEVVVLLVGSGRRPDR